MFDWEDEVGGPVVFGEVEELGDGGVLGEEVMFFFGVFGEVVEFDGLELGPVFSLEYEFSIAFADGEVVGVAGLGVEDVFVGCGGASE